MESKKNILVLTYWDFNDALVQTYTQPYIRIISEMIPKGSKIFLVTLDKWSYAKQAKLPEGIINISLPYVPFSGRAAFSWMKNIFKLRTLIKKEEITVIHAWCTPAGMIGYILSKLTGKELIIDSFEPHAEAMVENGEWSKDSAAYKLLFRFEKLQSQKAKYLIACSEGMKEYAAEKYGHRKNNIFVKPACIDFEQFPAKGNISLSDKMLPELKEKVVCVYAGKFGGIYLKEEVFAFFKACHNFWGDRFHALILSSHSSAEIAGLADEAELPLSSISNRFVPHKEIPVYLQMADFAITPVKPVPTKRYCSPIKDGEYWASGLPVVITKDISDDSGIIEEYKIGSILAGLNEEGYVRSILEIDRMLRDRNRAELAEEIRTVAKRYRNFSIAQKVYEHIYK
jgi:hypothetical protein